jgi:hypothetical protein
MNEIKEMDGDSIRDAVDARDRFDLLREAESERDHSYKGSMAFEARSGREYLIRTVINRGRQRKSLGVRSPETEAKLRQYEEGKARVENRISGLRKQIEARAPIIRARGIGRMPLLPARVLRKLDSIGLLGKSLTVLGTNALYAYEAVAGIRIESSMLATDDVDVLYDSRRKLVVGGEVNEKGLIGILQQVDKSFTSSSVRTYTASNRDGYMVDLLEPQDHDRIMNKGPGRMSDVPGDLVATTTDSSKWLLNVPKFGATAFDERGFPVPIVTLDPRVYALQKLWIVENDVTRAPDKRLRDREQANLVATIAVNHLGMSFDDPVLSGLPSSFRDLVGHLDIDGKNNEGVW